MIQCTYDIVYDRFNMFLKHSSSLPERSLLGTLVLGNLLNPAAVNKRQGCCSSIPSRFSTLWGWACSRNNTCSDRGLTPASLPKVAQFPGQGVGPGCDGNCIPASYPEPLPMSASRDRSTLCHADTELCPSPSSQTTLRDGLRTPSEVFAQQQTVWETSYGHSLSSQCWTDKLLLQWQREFPK